MGMAEDGENRPKCVEVCGLPISDEVTAKYLHYGGAFKREKVLQEEVEPSGETSVITTAVYGDRSIKDGVQVDPEEESCDEMNRVIGIVSKSQVDTSARDYRSDICRFNRKVHAVAATKKTTP